MHNEPKAASGYLHKALAAASGAVGGSFGLAALPIELPISTGIMLRSIGDIARAEGEDLRDPNLRSSTTFRRSRERTSPCAGCTVKTPCARPMTSFPTRHQHPSEFEPVIARPNYMCLNKTQDE